MKFKPISKYCFIGIPLTALGIIFWYFKLLGFAGIFFGSGVTIVILNLMGKLKK